MSDAETVALAEFDKLRAEINNRTTLSNQLLSYELTALGAGIAIFDKFPDVLLGLAAISTFLWLFWIDHTTQIYKIAAYLELKVAPRLRDRDQDLLSWERFLRRLDAGGASAEHELYGTSTGRRLRIQGTEWIGVYTAALLGFSPIVLLAIYTLPRLRPFWHANGWAAPINLHLADALRLATEIGVVFIWVFAWRQFRAFARMRNIIRDAILAAGSAPARTTLEAGREEQQGPASSV
jgi:hypothetical protein